MWLKPPRTLEASKNEFSAFFFYAEILFKAIPKCSKRMFAGFYRPRALRASFDLIEQRVIQKSVRPKRCSESSSNDM